MAKNNSSKKPSAMKFYSRLRYFLLNRMKLSKMRAPRIKTRIKPGCVICKQRQCIDKRTPSVLCKVNMNGEYDGRFTRNLTKLVDEFKPNKSKDDIKNFIIIEVYRCMPLLGDEQEKVPDWDMHIVRYSIVFMNLNMC